MSASLSIMAAERVNIWDPRSWRIRNIFQPKTLPREKQLPSSPPKFLASVVKANNDVAIKQLQDLAKEDSIVAHVEIAELSKPTATYTKDRIFDFVEAANRPVTVAEIAENLSDVAKSGVSSRVSEMRFAGSLNRIYMAHPVTGVFAFHYTVAETK